MKRMAAVLQEEAAVGQEEAEEGQALEEEIEVTEAFAKYTSYKRQGLAALSLVLLLFGVELCDILFLLSILAKLL